MNPTVNTDPVGSQVRLMIDPTPADVEAAALAYLRRHDALDLAPMLGLVEG